MTIRTAASRLAVLPALLLAVLALLPGTSAAQEVRVGIVDRAPFAMTGPGDARTGIAVELARLALERTGRTWTFETVEPGAVAAALAGGVDLVLPVAASAALEAEADLTHPVHTATLGAAKQSGGEILRVLRGLATWDFLRVVLSVAALLFVVGAIVWLIERGSNEKMFNRAPAKGLGDGFWWAGVTLTTIGYGDKAPATVPGRAVAMLWMLVGLAVSASLTATIVTLADDASSALDLPGDLEGRRIVAVEGGVAQAFLDREGLAFEAVEDEAAALEAVRAGDAEVALGSSPSMRAKLGQDLILTETELEPVLIAFATAEGDPLREDLNRALLDLTAAGTVQEVVQRYLPSD